ncbi:hypothetical protein FOPE_12722 [Fonsecaea pedrosoi]|nr:hypothetical protein FOPE_12722 [Fonsecaea pedrosoi]
MSTLLGEYKWADAPPCWFRSSGVIREVTQSKLLVIVTILALVSHAVSIVLHMGPWSRLIIISDILIISHAASEW